MNDFLPKRTLLGKLFMLEVYEFYDQPVLFACRNEKGQIYLAMNADVTDLSDIFLYVELSGKRFQELLQSKICLRSAFTKAESGKVMKLEAFFHSDEIRVVEVDCTELSDDWLSVEGEYLDLDNSISKSKELKVTA